MRWFNVFSLFVSAVHCDNREREDGARTEMGRQRDQSGQGSQRQCPHSGKVLTQNADVSYAYACAGCILSVSFFLHHRRSQSDRSFANASMRRQSNTTLKSPSHEWKATIQSPRPSQVKSSKGWWCRFPSMVFYTLTLSINITDDCNLTLFCL